VISARGLLSSSNGALPSARCMKPRAHFNTLDALDKKVCGGKVPMDDDFAMLGVIAGAGVLLLMLLVI
jgi:hypothetical protein